MSSATPTVTFEIDPELLYQVFNHNEVINLSNCPGILSASGNVEQPKDDFGSDGRYSIHTKNDTNVILVLKLKKRINTEPGEKFYDYANLWLTDFGSIDCRHGSSIITGVTNLTPSNGNSNQEDGTVSIELQLSECNNSVSEDFRIHFSVCYNKLEGEHIPVRWCYIDPLLKVKQSD